MGEHRTALVLLLILFFTFVSISEMGTVKAEPKTIVVPDHLPTIQKAMDNAREGDTIFVKKGTYEGPIKETLVIDKRLSFIGEDVENTKINLHPRWIESTQRFYPSYYEKAMLIEANDVMLSGFTITSVGGSLSTAGKRNQIKGNIIEVHLALAGSYTNVSNNTITRGISCYGSHHTIAENKIIGSGIVVWGTYDGNDSLNTIYGNTITECDNGIRLDGGGNTVFDNTIKNCYHAVTIPGMSSSNIVYANTVTDNIGGLELYGQGNDNVFHNNYVANNQYGVLLSYTYMMSPGENNTVYQNNFVDNVEQISTSPTYPGTTALTYPTGRYDNGRVGNYWSDYNGTDSDGDGIGDTPYIVDEYNKDNFPLMEPAIIPEFPSWTPLLIALVAVVVVAVVYRRKLQNRVRWK